MMKMLLRLLLNIFLGPQKDSDLVLENLALRQQLATIWQESLIIVKPETVKFDD